MQNDPKVLQQCVSAAGLVAPARKPAPAPLADPGPAPERASAAGLTVPTKKASTGPTPALAPCRPPRTQAERSRLFDRLRALRDSTAPGVNRNDLAVVLISACIGACIRTKPGIVSALNHLGFDPRHAGATVDRGARPAAGHWIRGADGRYRLPS